jgi:hypothetical protein
LIVSAWRSRHPPPRRLVDHRRRVGLRRRDGDEVDLAGDISQEDGQVAGVTDALLQSHSVEGVAEVGAGNLAPARLEFDADALAAEDSGPSLPVGLDTGQKGVKMPHDGEQP